jgi:ribonuclease R
VSPRIVAEVARRGKLVIGDPFFEAGTPIVLDRSGAQEARPGDLVVVETGRGRPRVEQVLGPASSVDAALDGWLVASGAEPPTEPFELRDPSREDRVDLRDLVTFTIDPETAKDFDDALSFRREGDGLRAWVHIADVSAYVRAGEPLDHGAAERGFSVYVPGRVAPMLPHELADDACSLRPRVERLCVTVEIPFGPGLELGEPRFYRSIIRSDARLSYGQAQRILSGKESVDESVEAPVLEALRLCEELSAELRRRRFARGALRIETPEIAFAFDGQGGVADAWLESEPLAHSLVEELMILANECVGSLLAERRSEVLFRIHERPDAQAVTFMLQKLTALEVPTPPVPKTEELTPSRAAELAAATAELVASYAQTSGRGREAFPSLVLRSLKQARYDPRNLGHSGLASRAYAHFTSPIRRYPDLVVHRALLRELGLDDEPPPEDVGALGERLSAVEREGATVERRADAMCLAWLLEARLFLAGWEERFEGEIIGVIESGIFVRFGVVFEGYLPVRKLDGYFELNELGVALVARRGGGSYRLGDPIEVSVEKIERSAGKVELMLPGATKQPPRPPALTRRKQQPPRPSRRGKGRRR